VEKRIFKEHSGELIGNQSIDFWKQDGVTEIEESLLANPVEWRMNDDLLKAEFEGKIKINRAPAFVSCVSNFSNFLDLFRKTLRNLEVGVPVVVRRRASEAMSLFVTCVLVAKTLHCRYSLVTTPLSTASGGTKFS